ncbi:MAG: hypothetical protein ACRCTP_06040 [Aeromonas popoffii]|uniref:hypothetical protein n=1 Tax=Aeromonas popoffii TaxID=70856 RepID=UPI003F33628B
MANNIGRIIYRNTTTLTVCDYLNKTNKIIDHTPALRDPSVNPDDFVFYCSFENKPTDFKSKHGDYEVQTRNIPDNVSYELSQDKPQMLAEKVQQQQHHGNYYKNVVYNRKGCYQLTTEPKVRELVKNRIGEFAINICFDKSSNPKKEHKIFVYCKDQVSAQKLIWELRLDGVVAEPNNRWPCKSYQKWKESVGEIRYASSRI